VTVIVDLSASPAGRFCARLAALAGDEVIRFREPDQSNHAAAHARRVGIREAYLADGVTELSVDWAKRDHHSVVEPYLGRADAVISSFHKGRFDSPYNGQLVRRLNPAAVHVVVSPFGIAGPYREYASSSLIDWAAGGYLYITGEPDKPPLPGPLDLCAYATGYMAAIALEATLAQVRSGGPSRMLDISHMETMSSLHQSAFPRLASEEVMTRAGNVVGPATYPHGSYPCGDRELFLGIVTDEEWDRFLIAIDRPELCHDPRFATGAARKAHPELTDGIVSSWTIHQGVAEVAAAFLQERRVPATACATPGDLLQDSQLDYRHYFRPTTIQPGHLPARVPGNVMVVQQVANGGIDKRRPAPQPANRPWTSAPDEAVLPLAGVNVLDLSLWWAGPMATRILGDLGANVIRVERPTQPADENAWPQWHRFVHEQMHRNKRSIVVDLSAPEGLAIVQRLISGADVCIQNYRPGVMERLGLGWKSVLEANPSLVYVSLSGYGSDGPKSGWGTYGTLSEAASAVRALTHYPGEGGMRLGDQLPDAICGLVGTLAALRGLRERCRTGIGSYFDISQLEAYVALIGEEIAAASLPTDPVAVDGAALDQFDGLFVCRGAEEWVAVTVPDPELVSKVTASLSSELGVSSGRALTDLLEDFSAGRTKQAVAEFLQARGIAAFPVQTARDLVEDAHLRARQYFHRVSLGGLSAALPGSPIRAEGRPVVQMGRPAPVAGEHSIEILRDDLSLSEEEVDSLLHAGVVRQNQPR
jgi:crotonobetainyl-CoA:carnitine CoA-transferase CaiB-like acyl-CoA transferase